MSSKEGAADLQHGGDFFVTLGFVAGTWPLLCDRLPIGMRGGKI